MTDSIHHRKLAESAVTLPPDGEVTGEETGGATASFAEAVAGLRFGPPVAPGETGVLGPYRIIREVGHGGMGAVFAAIDTRLDRRLALKVMLPKFAGIPAARDRFLREAGSAARIKHDHVVTIYEADERDGIPYIAMEFLDGCPLNEYLKRHGNLPVEQVLRIALETAAGLRAAHDLGLIHRDIKPGNLWLEAPHGRVKILDFGLAKPADAAVELTKHGTVIGTPAFMSPEQARGERVGPRSDLFSLGATLYRLCTGRIPFPGANTLAVLSALASEEPKPVRELNPDVPAPLADLIHQMLTKNPAGRPATAEEVVARLEEMLRDPAAAVTRSGIVPIRTQPMRIVGSTELNPFRSVEGDPTTPGTTLTNPPPTPPPGGKRKWLAASLAAAVLLAAGVTAVIVNRSPTGGTAATRMAPPATDKDRKPAEWALRNGGQVWVNGDDREILDPADLPQEPFHLTGVKVRKRKAVTDADVAVLDGCTELVHLTLDGTAVTDDGLAIFRGCVKLRTLDLGSTAVTGRGLAHFKECRDLRHLDLGETAVTDDDLALFKHCTRLTFLRATKTGVTAAGLSNFRGFTDFTHLYLNGQHITDEAIAHFQESKGLRQLWLEQGAVTDDGLAIFRDFRKIDQLYLGGCRVTDAGLANFKGCEGMRDLKLPDTGLSDAGLALFHGFKALTVLNVKNTNVTVEGLKQFHQVVRWPLIVYDGGEMEPKGPKPKS